MKIKSIDSCHNLKNKKVLLRVDFNVPLKNGKIVDDYRIVSGLKTINYLLEKKAKIIIIAHLGEPEHGFEKDCSLKPVAAYLQKLLKKKVWFISAIEENKIEKALVNLKEGEIIFLENLRFYQGELDNNDNFAKLLASFSDLYVNDAFAVCHRDQASVSAIKKYLPSYAGLLLADEIRALAKILKPKKPLVVIMGGAKISTKEPLISKLYPVASEILIGGALANNFWKFQSINIGKSLYDKDSEKDIKKFYKRGKLRSKIILPLDVIVKTKKGEAVLKKPENVINSDTICDIGPETIFLYASYIRKAKSLIWNGPLGKFEEKNYKHGTINIASAIAARSKGPAYGVVGGGETIEALKMTKMAEYVDWISTAGGAMLTFLGGGKMPGLKKIIN
jgi:phosphoglycerate kinase